MSSLRLVAKAVVSQPVVGLYRAMIKVGWRLPPLPNPNPNATPDTAFFAPQVEPLDEPIEPGFEPPLTPNIYSFSQELPKVLSIYDIDIPVPQARLYVKEHFTQNSHIEDPRVIDMLVNKGYMELEETLMQWKQKAQLMRVFEERYVRKSDEDVMLDEFFSGNEKSGM